MRLRGPASPSPKPLFHVAAGGGGDFRSLQEALDVAPPEGARISIARGLYREKLFADSAGLELEGEGAGATRILWDDSARRKGPDGLPLGSFRSYTAYFGGPGLRLRGLGIENSAGGGGEVGQALALYLDSADAIVEDCAILGRQDSLFLGPLPPTPRIPGSFAGPGEKRARGATRQVFKNCLIAGDVDFIFGSSEALFLNCEIRSLALPSGEPGYVTAASTPEGAAAGFTFLDCRLTSEPGCSGVFLGRPWRPHARVSFLRCELGPHLDPRGWADWEDSAERERVRFSEGGCYGPAAEGGARGGRASWARLLGEEETEEEARRVLELFGLG